MRSDNAGPAWTDAPVRVLCAQGGGTQPDALVDALTASDERFEPRVAVGQDAVERTLAATDFEAVVCEHAPPELDAVRTLSVVRERDESVPVLVHAPETEVARDVFRGGTTDFVPTDGSPDYDLLARRLTDAVRDRRSTDRYRQIFEQASEGIVVHDPETGAVLETNARLAEMLGFDADAALSLGDVVASGGEYTVEAARERIRAAHEEGPTTFEWRNGTSDGDGQWVEVSLKPAVVGSEEVVLGFVRDTTERHEFERRYEQTRDHLGRVVDRVDDAFLALDADWRFTFVNAEAERLLGRSADDLLGEHIWTEFPEASGSQFQAEYERAMDTQEPVTFEASYEPLDLDLAVDAYPAPDGLSVFFRDVTDRRRREDVLNGVLDVTRDLMRAETVADVADLVTEAATDVLGYDLNAVRYYHPAADELRVASLSEAAADAVDPPPLAPGEDHVGRVFERGDAMTFDDLGEVSDHDYRPVRSAMVLPLDDYGTLSVGATETGAFDDLNLSVATLLAASATVAIERVRSRRELRRYEAVVRSVEGMVCVVDDGEFSLVTEPFASFLGYDHTELVGRPVDDVLAPETREAWDRTVATLDTSGADGAFEAAVLRADGTERPVELELSRLGGEGLDGVVAVARDIGELVATRRRVTAQRRRFTHLFDYLPDPVVEVTLADGTVRAVNDAFADVFGYDATDVVGESLETFVRADGRPERFPAPDEPPRVTESERETAAGRRTFLIRTLSYERDGIVHAFAVYTDITEQQERERYLQILNRLVRHNLRNALTVVVGNAAEIGDRADDPTVRELAERVGDQAETLDELSEEARAIEDVLGTDASDRVRIDLAPRLRSLADRYRDEVDLTVAVPDSLPVAGIDALERAVEELLENAVEHSSVGRQDAVEHSSTSPDSQARGDAVEHGGPAPRETGARRGRPTVRLDASVAPGGDRVEIRVADDGPGIPESEWATIVGEEDITQLSHGTGLGLWLVRWIVEACNGDLRLVEDGDWATDVVISVPRWRDPPA